MVLLQHHHNSDIHASVVCMNNPVEFTF